jgi:hypothetical protein
MKTLWFKLYLWFGYTRFLLKKDARFKIGEAEGRENEELIIQTHSWADPLILLWKNEAKESDSIGNAARSSDAYACMNAAQEATDKIIAFYAKWKIRP